MYQRGIKVLNDGFFIEAPSILIIDCVRQISLLLLRLEFISPLIVSNLLLERAHLKVLVDDCFLDGLIDCNSFLAKIYHGLMICVFALVKEIRDGAFPSVL